METTYFEEVMENAFLHSISETGSNHVSDQLLFILKPQKWQWKRKMQK